jgi:hypothetical protein
VDTAKEAVFALVYFSSQVVIEEDATRVLKELTGLKAINKVVKDKWCGKFPSWHFKICTE